MIKFKQLSLIFQTCFDGTFVIFSVTYFETNCPFEFYNTKNFAALSNYSSFNMADTLKSYLKHALLVSGDHVHKSDLTRSRLLLRRQEPVCVRDQTFRCRRHRGYVCSRFNHGREIVCEMNAVWCEIFSKYLILVFFISESENVIANQAKYLLDPLMICQITHCKRAASRRREAVRRQPNRAVRERSKAEKISNPPYIVM